MEAITEKTDWKFEKESSYACDNADFVVPHELTVTITLNEYRRLVKREVEAEKDKMQSELWKTRCKNEELEKRIKELTSVIAELQLGQCEKVNKDA